MNIALDHDGTYTVDPAAWLVFVQMMRLAGHKVYVVTMRYESECTQRHHFDQRLRTLCEVVATGRKAKRPACEALGIVIDVWIDDRPETVFLDAAPAFGGGDVYPEGQPHVPATASHLAAPTAAQAGDGAATLPPGSAARAAAVLGGP
jgi:hypothetical protein